MNLVLVRHSKSLVNPDIPIPTWGLSEEGVILAKGLREITVINSLEVVYSSLQSKALETAVYMTKNSGIQIKTDNRLTESTSFTNKFVDLEQLAQNTKDYYSNTDLSINNGETFQEALNRFMTAIENIIKAEAGKKNIGIVSHGNILAAFSNQYIHKDVYQLAESIKQPDIAVLNWETRKFTTFFGEL